AIALLTLGISTFLAFELIPYETATRARLRKYTQGIAAQLKLLHSDLRPEVFVACQGVALLAGLALLPIWPLVGGLLLIATPFASVLLNREHTKRVNRLEEQLDGWVTAL